MFIPRLRIAASLLLIALTAPAVPGFGAPDPDLAQVEENLLPYNIIEGQPAYRLQDRMEHYRVPGLSIAVIRDFAVQEVVHFGVARAGSEQLVDGETRFNVGSLSKAMTSACILEMIQQGELELNEDVNEKLKSWQVPTNEFTAQAPVTPLLLMNHSAGMPHRTPFASAAENMPTPLQLVTGRRPSRLPPLEVFQKPGAGFQYSNGGFTVLQILAEDVAGLPFAELVRRRVLVPLGLDRTTFTTPLPDSLLPLAPPGHDRLGRPVSEPRGWLPHTAAGGLWTTAEDYARFVVELQLSAQDRSNKLFSRALAGQMLSPHASTQYGLGVFLYEGNGVEPFFSHIGDGPGFVGGFTAHRTDGFGAVVLTNGAGGINLCREILRSVAQVYDWPGYLPPVRRELPLTAAETTEFQGRFRLGLDTVVSLTDGGGFLEVTSENLTGFRLFRVAPDTLVCRERKGTIALGRDPEGKVAYLAIHLSDDIGRLGEKTRHALRMEAGQHTPLEMLLAGRTEAAYEEYIEFKGRNRDDPQIQESRFNRLGYSLLGREELENALAVFRLNTLLYPVSANVFDSYGEALLTAGRREEAVANYRKSLRLNPDNTNAAQVLEKLGVGK